MSIPGPLLLSAPVAVVSQRTSTVASYVATYFMMIIMTFMHNLQIQFSYPGHSLTCEAKDQVGTA